MNLWQMISNGVLGVVASISSADISPPKEVPQLISSGVRNVASISAVHIPPPDKFEQLISDGVRKIIDSFSPAQAKDAAKCLLPHPAWGCINAKCYAIGTQGPCSDRQVFLEVPESVDKAILRGGALGRACAYNYNEGLDSDRDDNLNRDFNKMHPPVINPDLKYGYCVWDDLNYPCHGRPANQRYSNETQACHTVGLQEHCGNNLLFQEVPDNSLGGEYGGCDCADLRRMWYDPQNESCFAPHTQGWCPDGQWLTMKSEAGPVICEPTPCPVDGEHAYWDGQCYRRGETGPCDQTGNNRVVLFPGNLMCEGPGMYPSLASFAPARESLRQRCRYTFSKLPSNYHHVLEACRGSYSYKRPEGKSNPCGDGTYSQILNRCVETVGSSET